MRKIINYQKMKAIKIKYQDLIFNNNTNMVFKIKLQQLKDDVCFFVNLFQEVEILDFLLLFKLFKKKKHSFGHFFVIHFFKF